MGTIWLIGDGILDNFYWLTDRNRDLVYELSQLKFKVKNFALDDVKLDHISNGITPNKTYAEARHYPYEVEVDGKVYPLKLFMHYNKINRSFTSVYDTVGSLLPSTKHDNMIVVSLGGNNLRKNMLSILRGVDHYMNNVLNTEFINAYDSLIKQLKSYCERIVLVSIYLPFLGPGASYGMYAAYTKPVMKRWHYFLQEVAMKHNIPILDLSSTLNPNDRSHYGTVDIYPSNISNQCIAECISYIYNHYDGFHIYSAPNCDAQHIRIKKRYK